MGTPLFSVVIPTYNRASRVVAAVRSVLAQSDGDFECIIVDDGSSDDTRPRLESLADPRLCRMFNPVNRGQHVCRNQAIKRASGRFVTFLDSDDFYLPRRLAVFRRHIESRPEVGFWFSNAFVYRDGVIVGRIFDPARKVPEGRVPGWYAVGDRFLPYVTTNVAIRREVFDRFGLFREDLKILEDTELYARMLGGGVEVGVIPEALSVRSLHEAQITRDYERDYQEALLALKSGGPSSAVLNQRKEEMILEAAGYLWKSCEPARARSLLERELGPGAKSRLLYALTYVPVWLLSAAKKLRRGYLQVRHHRLWAGKEGRLALDSIAAFMAGENLG